MNEDGHELHNCSVNSDPCSSNLPREVFSAGVKRLTGLAASLELSLCK